MKFSTFTLLPFSLVFFFQNTESESTLSSKDTNFRLYKGNVNNYVTKSFSNFSDLLMNNVYFDKEKLTIVYFHGYTETLDEDSPMTVMSSCSERGDINCIACDWSRVAALPYFEAISTGLQLGADFADELNKASVAKLIALKNTRLVGHSLGAHVCGYCGKSLKTKYQVTLSRITGLDPAGPGFYATNTENLLQNGDADAVDIIHTDMGLSILRFIIIPFLSQGTSIKSGDADFLPNNGVDQPGCTDILGTCSHQRSTYFYAESLSLFNANSFTSRNAWSYKAYKRNRTRGTVAHMGFYWNPNHKGLYYLQTNSASPFSQG